MSGEGSSDSLAGHPAEESDETPPPIEWLTEVRARLGADNFKVIPSPRCWILTDLDPSRLAPCISSIEDALSRVPELLPELNFLPHFGRWPIILFSDQDQLVHYHAWIRPIEDEVPSMTPGGFWTIDPLGHFILQYESEGTLTGGMGHELVHAACSYKGLPRWLEEGLATNVETAMGRRPHVLAHDSFELSELRELLAHHPDPRTLLRPEGFYDPDYSHLAYAIGQMLVTRLMGDRQRFFAFLRDAREEDDGKAALAAHFGLDVHELLPQVFDVPRARGILAQLLQLLFVPGSERRLMTLTAPERAHPANP